MRFLLIAFVAAFCAAQAVAAPLWTPCASSSSDCERVSLPMPMEYGGHGAARNTTNPGPLFLSLYRRVATTATATTSTVVIVSDTTDEDPAQILAWMKRVGQRTSANVYFAFTRLPGWPVNSTMHVNIPEEALGPTPCGSLAYINTLSISAEVTKTARNCRDWLNTSFGALGASVYSLEAAAQDFASQLHTVQEIHPSNVFVMAVGGASRIVQTYLALEHPVQSSSTPLAGFVFDSPRALHLTTAFDAAAGESTSRFLDSCDADATCRSNFAALGVSLRDVVNDIMLRLDTKKLRKSISPCVQSLLDAAYDDNRDLALSHGLRRFLTAVRRQTSLAKLLPVLLFRVHRCHEQDVKVLERLLGDAQDMLFDSFYDKAQSRFIEQVTTFSDGWPVEVPSWQELVRSFETSPMGAGEMVQQQLSFCLYSGDTSAACASLYDTDRKADSSLVLTYPRSSSVAAAMNKSTSVPGEVLILASRLSTVGSDTVAAQLYDAFKDNGKTSTKLLVETDSLSETELLAGEIYMSQEGVEIEVGAQGDDALRVLELFLSGKLRAASGQWHVSDLLSEATTTPTELPASLTSTYGKAPVAVNLTLLPEEKGQWFPDDKQDPYASHLTVAVNTHGIGVWYVALIVFAAVAVLLIAGWFIRVARKKRRYQAAQTSDPKSP